MTRHATAFSRPRNGRWLTGRGTRDNSEERYTLALSFLTSAAIQVLNVLTGVLLARQLGPHGRGELAAVLLWPSILAAVGSLGLVEATTYHVARAITPVSTIIGTSLVLALLQSTVLVLIGIAILPVVLGQYGGDALRSAHIFLLYIPLNLSILYLMAVLNGRYRLRSFNALRFLVFACTALAVVALALTNSLTIDTAVFAYLGANLLTLAATAVIVLRAEERAWRYSGEIARNLLGFGLRSHTSNVSSMLNERLDQLVISVFLAPAKLGLYVIAVTLTSLTSLVGTSVSIIALPVIARSRAGSERTSVARGFIRLTLVGSALLTAPLLVLTPNLIGIFFGSAFSSAAGVTRVLLVAAVILSTNRILSAVLKGAGRPLDTGIAEGGALLATVGGLAVFLPTLGLLGAGIASLLAYGVSSAWMVHRAAVALDISSRALLLPGDRPEARGGPWSGGSDGTPSPATRKP